MSVQHRLVFKGDVTPLALVFDLTEELVLFCLVDDDKMFCQILLQNEILATELAYESTLLIQRFPFGIQVMDILQVPRQRVLGFHFFVANLARKNHF